MDKDQLTPEQRKKLNEIRAISPDPVKGAADLQQSDLVQAMNQLTDALNKKAEQIRPKGFLARFGR